MYKVKTEHMMKSFFICDILNNDFIIDSGSISYGTISLSEGNLGERSSNQVKLSLSTNNCSSFESELSRRDRLH